MVSTGAIDQAAASSARGGHRVKLVQRPRDRGIAPASYFKEQVRRELVERFGWQRVYQGGLRSTRRSIPTLQRAAEALVENGLADIEKRRGYKHPKRGRRGAQGRRAPAVSAGRAGGDGSDDRLRARDGRRPRLRREPLQPRDAGQAAAGLRVQAVRLCRRARGGLFAGDGHQQSGRADRRRRRAAGCRRTNTRPPTR